jgi:hypothetical protein
MGSRCFQWNCPTAPYTEGSNVLRYADSSDFADRSVSPLMALMMFGLVATMTAGLPVSSGAQSVYRGVPEARSDSGAVRQTDAPWSFGVWFAGGTHEPLKTRAGHVEDRALYILGVSASRRIARWRFGELHFAPTLVPGILATANREYKLVDQPSDGSGALPLKRVSIPYKKSAFGAGLLPVAAEVTMFGSARAGLVIGGGGGAAYFNRRIPDPGETRFNFLADGHAGIYLRTGPGVTILGFRLQHISNGDTGRVNPGMDSRMLYVGFSR